MTGGQKGALSHSSAIAFALRLLALLFAVALASPMFLLVARAADGDEPEAQPEPQELVIDWERTDFYLRSMEAERIGGTETEPGTKMGQGSSSPFVMVEWQVTNNMDLSRPFVAHIPTKSLTVPNQSGQVPCNGEFVGSYDVSQGDDGTVDLLISLDAETLRRQSDIRGGIRVNCRANMDPGYELPEDQVCDMCFGEATCWVSYDAPGSYSMSKSMKNLTQGDNGTYVAHYAIDISYRGLMRDRVLTDSPTSSNTMQYLDGSLTATLDGRPLDVSATKVGEGFRLPLPDSNEGKSSHQLHIEYDMPLTAQPSMLGDLSNDATLAYTDESGSPAELRRACNASLKPEIRNLKKEGTPIFDRSEKGNWMGFGAQYTFGVLYTISFSSSNLKYFPDEVITIEDFLGDATLRNGKYVATDKTVSPGFSQDSTFGTIFGPLYHGAFGQGSWQDDLFYTDDGRYDGSKTNLPPVDAERYAYNACKIFQYGQDNNFAVTDFESRGETYVLRYIVPVKNAMTMFQIDNAVNVTIGDNTKCAKTTTPIKPTSMNLITKIADKGYRQHSGWHNNYGSPYVYHSSNLEYGYSLSGVLNDDERTVSYSVPVCLSHLARPYDDNGGRRVISSNGAWTSHVNGWSKWKIIDVPYQSFNVSVVDSCTTYTETSGAALSTEQLLQSIRNLRIEIYRSPSRVGDSIPDWSPTWEPSWKPLENAYVTYALEHGRPEAPKDGFDAETFQSLYSAYVTARDRDGYGDYYQGELRFDGRSSIPLQNGSSYNDILFGFENGQIIATMSTSGITYAKGYNQSLGWNSGGGVGISSLYSSDDYIFVLRYDLAVTDDGESLVTPDARYNGARLQLDWLDQQKDIPDCFLVADTTLSAPIGSTTPVSGTPWFGKGIHANEKDESGYTRKVTYKVGMEVADRSHIAFEDPISDDLELLTGDDGRPDVKAVWCNSYYSVPSEPTFVDASEVDISYEGGKLTVGMDIPAEKPNNYVVFLIGTRPKLGCLTGTIRNEAYDVSSEDESLHTESDITFSPSLPPLVHKHFVSNAWERTSQNLNPYSENGKWYAYYEIDVDPWGDDIDREREVLIVRDDMGLSLTLVEDSVQFVSTGTGEPIAGGSFEAVENGWKFTVPDGQATSIRYKVALSEEDTPILHMGDSDSLRNSAVLVLGDKEYSQSSANQGDKVMGQYAWMESSNGSVTLFKFCQDGDNRMPLAGARFSLESAWDNLGNAYTGHEGDEIYETYREFVVEDAVAGRRIIESLPKDRIYRLTETGLPDGYTYPEGHDAGTWYFYVAGRNEATLLATDIPSDIRKGLIKVDDGGLLPIENVEVVPEEPKEEPQPEPTSPNDTPDTPEGKGEDKPSETSEQVAQAEPKATEAPRQQPAESGQANDTIQPTGTRAVTKGSLLQTGGTVAVIGTLVSVAGTGFFGYVLARRGRRR